MSTFAGYRRNDGTVGTRNYVGVLASVICSTTPVQAIADRVPGTVAVVHPLGCAQVGDDLRQTRRSLTGVAVNGNIASVLIVGLGCENNQPADLADLIESSKPIDVIGIQALGGSDKVVETGTSIVERWVKEAAQVRRTEEPVSELHVGVLGIEWDPNNSDETHSTIGSVVDRLVGAGARVTVGVDQALAPAGPSLAGRATESTVKARLEDWGTGRERRRWQSGHTLDRQPWGDEAILRAERMARLTGSAPITGVLSYSDRPASGGLHLMEVPSDPVEAMTGLVAGGATLVLVASNRGILSGAIACPTLVVAPSASRGSALDAAVDHYIQDTGAMERSADALWERLIAVASGEQSRLEEADLHDFAIPQVSTPF